MSSTTLAAHTTGPLRGRIRVPGDKSISHRALILGALSTGRTRISGLLEAEDVLNTAAALQALGTPIARQAGEWHILGRGVGGLAPPAGALDFGNSGTGVRLMMGVIAGHPLTADLIGDASLSRRPMGRVLTPLQKMGVGVAGDNEERLPLKITGRADLIPIVYELPVPSAQVKSAVLLAGLHAAGQTTVIESEPTRDHTERMFRYFGADVQMSMKNGQAHITVTGQAELNGRDVSVPADPSSAAFPTAAAILTADSDVLIEDVLINPTRTGFYETLREMGANLTFENERDAGGEPVANLRVKASRLRGVRVPPERAPSMIDEYPILAVLAAFAEGPTEMDGLGELKVKESDRLSATAAGLNANGVGAIVEDDRLTVQGTGGSVPGGGIVQTHLDHRIAMAFLIMGLAGNAPVTVDDASMIATSFPSFVPLMEELGAQFVEGDGGVS